MEDLDKALISCVLEAAYQSDDTFLCHLTGSTPYFAYSQTDIDDLVNPTSSPKALNATSDFSRLIHQTPRQKNYIIGNSLLWQDYSLLFDKVVLAGNKLESINIHESMSQEMQSKYLKYKAIREEIFQSVNAYSKAYSENRDDDTWKKESMPLMLGAIESLQKKWVNKDEGAKGEIEKYIDDQIATNTLSYTSLWALWKGKFSEFLSVNADLKGPGSDFATFYVDFNNANNINNWQKASFTHESIINVLPHNPFKNTTDDLVEYVKKIETLNISYLKLNIERTWFVPKIFDAKFWKMHPDYESEIISDGKLSADCQIPSYISDVIFIKEFSKTKRLSLIEAGLEWFGTPLFKLINRNDSNPEDCYFLAAFVCKTVPKCANPDLNLKWS